LNSFPNFATAVTIILTFYNEMKRHMKLEIFAAYIVAMTSVFPACNKTSGPNDDTQTCTIQC